MSLTSRQVIAIERRMADVKFKIDSRDRNRIACALRVAVEQYRRDATDCAGSTLAAHFTLQADECELIAERLEP